MHLDTQQRQLLSFPSYSPLEACLADRRLRLDGLGGGACDLGDIARSFCKGSSVKQACNKRCLSATSRHQGREVHRNSALIKL